jgi:beta-lactamase class A
MFDLTDILELQKDKLIAVAYRDHETDAEYYLNADEPLHPASTMKVHVMMEVFRQANEGLFSLEERLPVINSFTSIADGSRYSLDAVDDSEQTLYQRIGETESIHELTRLMIVRSSNLATNILIEKVGAGNVDEFVRALGIEGVIIRRGIEDNAAFRLGMNNSATARGLTQTMDLIARKKVASERASQQMIDILLGQEFNQSIPALLPNFVKVAHKTGWTGDVYHDTGIVYPPHREPCVLSIMTRGFAEEQENEAHACMAKIARRIYEEILSTAR